MKFYLDNGTYALRNMGDVAMLQLAYQRFSKRWPDAEIVIQTDDAARLNQLVPEAESCSDQSSRQWKQLWNIFGGIHKLLPKSLHDDLRYLEFSLRMKYPRFCSKVIRRRLKNRSEQIQFETFISHLQTSDAVVATGGGYIADEFEIHAISILETLGLAESFGHPVAMFGQGIGPIDSPRLRRVATRVLPRIHLIALREGRKGPELLRQLGVSADRIVITGDDAIDVASKLPRQLGNGIGFNVRVAGYAGIDVILSKLIVSDVQQFATKIGAHVLPIPISMNEGESDSISLDSLLELDSEERRTLAKIDSPQSVIEQVGRCRIVITGSYHAGVFALSKGIPVVALVKSAYYADKFRGLAEQFRCGCEIVDLNSSSWRTEFVQSVSQLWERSESYTSSLLECTLMQTELSKVAYERFFDLVDACRRKPKRKQIASLGYYFGRP